MTAQALTELNRPETAPETGGAYVLRQYLRVSEQLAGFVESEVLPGTGIAPESFWQGLAAIAASFAPRNRALLERRADLQRRIDDWHRANPQARSGAPEAFLREIG